MSQHNQLIIQGAREHNLKDISLTLPKDKLVVITGLSGSGKSSLAFDTIYAEGQRRYVESLSAYARQFLGMMKKPDVDSIEGLAPAISIEQKTTHNNPRSTVGTVTEIYDYLRLLFARVGVPHSPTTGLPIVSQTVPQMVDRIMALPKGTRLMVLAPIVRGRKGEYKKELDLLKKQGFQRVQINGEIYDLDELPTLDKQKKHTIEVVVDRVVVAEGLESRLHDTLETALKLADGIAFAAFVQDKPPAPLIFSTRFSCPESGFTLTEIEPRLFSFNSPYGACPTCNGLGASRRFDPGLVVPNPELSLKAGAVLPWENIGDAMWVFENLARTFNFSMTTPFQDLPDDIQDLILLGKTPQMGKKELSQRAGKRFSGVIPWLERRLTQTNSERVRADLEKFQSNEICETCKGYRLKAEALCVKIAGQHIGKITELSITEAHAWAANLAPQLTPQQQQIAHLLLKEIQSRVAFLENVGLSYLTLARAAGTLSGGESQRIRLASQVGSRLTGVLYVLDEPSIGLHQRDNDRLIGTLKHLRDIGNTVIVVEHDEDTIRTADHVVDIGPGAGVHGGYIIAEGSPAEIEAAEASITGQYLRGVRTIPMPEKRRDGTGAALELRGVRTNNLQNVTARFPLGTFTCVTGVSGSGKSSLVNATLYPALARALHASRVPCGPFDSILGLERIDKVIDIDQSPIGRTPRSNPVTYIDAFTGIRDLFTGLPESKARGYAPGRFSFNVSGGRCEACQGDGVVKIEMHFLPDVYVTCDECRGSRYNRETLTVLYKGKSIADVLDMTIEEAHGFFEAVPFLAQKFQTLVNVGLGYMKVGQPATTLSGGEAQRVKLAKELSKRSTGRTVYILDEPTTGLHFEDIRRLLEVLHRFTEKGNTVIVIEHNLEVIKTADWVIDLGPEGGAGGGYILAEGTPETLIECPESRTGQYLAPILKRALHASAPKGAAGRTAAAKKSKKGG